MIRQQSPTINRCSEGDDKIKESARRRPYTLAVLLEGGKGNTPARRQLTLFFSVESHEEAGWRRRSASSSTLTSVDPRDGASTRFSADGIQRIDIHK
jgi:hypothetical protein